MKTAIGYCRVSTREQGMKRNGLDAQEADLIHFCECNDIVLIDCIAEVASGGYDLNQRPVLAEVVDRCKEGGHMLMVAKLDRFSRSVEFVSSQMNALSKARIGFVSCEHGLEVDPFLLHLYASLAEKERKLIGQRTKKALAAVKARGVVLGAGSHKDGGRAWRSSLQDGRLTLVRQATAFAETMRPIIEPMRQQGMTFKAIADRLNQYATPTAKGGKWSIVSVRNLTLRWD